MKLPRLLRYILTASVFITLSINGFGQAPALGNLGITELTYTEGDAATQISTSLTVSDADSPTLASATITISDGYLLSEDFLSVDPNPLFTIGGGFSGGTLTINPIGVTTFADWITELRNVKYFNSKTGNPNLSPRTITFVVSDGPNNSAPASRVINIIPVNDKPVLGGISGTLSYTEGDAAKVIDNGITVSDVDNTTLASATIYFSGGYISGEDFLSVIVSDPLSASTFNTSTGTLTITGSGTLLQYQNALKDVKYDNTNDSTPNPSTRTVSFVIDDGSSVNNLSNTVTKNIIVTPVNDAPITAPDLYSGILEGGTLTTTIGNGVLKNDRDPDGPAALTAQLISSPLYGSLTFYSNGTFTYIHNGTNNLSDGFTYKASDSELQSIITNVQFTITGLNDPPILSGIDPSPLSFTEDDVAKYVSSTIIVTDDDNADLSSAVIEIEGNYYSTEDSLYFTPQVGLSTAGSTPGKINVSGVATKADYQTFLQSIKYKNYNRNNPSTLTRTVSYIVNDGVLNSNIESRQITITPVNDPPVAKNATISGTNFFIGDNLTGSYTFTDPDLDLPGLPTYKWFTSANANGIPMSTISGATTSSFTLRYGDGGKYIAIGVTPVDDKGLSGVADTSSWHYVNAAPVFTDTTVQNIANPGTYAVGETVSSAFVYYDKEGNAAGAHNYQWYRSQYSSGSGAVPIAGAITSSYLISDIDTTKFISLQVLPKALAGSTPGRLFQSGWISVSKLPSASIKGTDSICDNVLSKDTLYVTLSSSNPTVSYTYQRNNDAPVTVAGVVGLNNLIVSDTGTYKLIKVFDQKYNFGIIIKPSAKVSYYKKPTASLPLATLSICSNDTSTSRIPVAHEYNL
jgi:VCBS repeat-containing protein